MCHLLTRYQSTIFPNHKSCVRKKGVPYGIPEFKDAVDQLLAVYWDENTICGVAADAEGNYGPVIRQMVNLTKEGASPAGELIGGGLSNINLMDMRQAKFAHR